MKSYFEWQSDLHVPCTVRFAKYQERGLKLQNTYSCNPFKNWEQLWEICETARAMISQFIHSNSINNVILTQGTMEGLMRILYMMTRDPERLLTSGDTILTTDCEFPPLYLQLFPDFNIQIVKIWKCSKAQICNHLIKALTHSNRPIKAVFLSHVLYRNGAELPLKEIIAEIRRVCKNVTIIIDGAQAVGQISLNVADIDADFYVADFHKWVQGPNFTGFIHCRTEAMTRMLVKHATHPMAFSRSFGIENSLCSKFGPLPFAFAAIPAALKGFLSGKFRLDSFRLADRLRSKIIDSPKFMQSLHLLAKEDLSTGTVVLPLEVKQKGLRKRLFEKYGLLASEHWPQIIMGLKRQIFSCGFLRIGCSDNWNTEQEIDEIFNVLEEEWQVK